LSTVTGYVLPLARGEAAQWISGQWFLRDERLYLLPGDSPMGYRLPLDSLPWASKADYPWQFEQDPFAPSAPLPAAAPLRAQSQAAAFSPAAMAALRGAARGNGRAGGAPGGTSGAMAGAMAGTIPARGESDKDTVRTAICVEVRHPSRTAGPAVEWQSMEDRRGILYVFMPPLTVLEDYLALLGEVEATAAELGVKIVLEGYPPPRDARLKLLQVTPDPGVIEVNIHPASHWDELVEHTEFLYQAAHETHLSTEKFMLDGRHTGTGGGNHFVLGGATPADSPFLRRPDVLASLIAYWLNHPSLSYLFSGLFIGPPARRRAWTRRATSRSTNSRSPSTNSAASS
jgi:uncharacterized protein (DUF2126 family)